MAQVPDTMVKNNLDPLLDERAAIEERIRLLEEKERLEAEETRMKASLPHLYGWPWYQWAWDFFTSTNRHNLLCAANQISKSSTQIRKCIHWATATDLWPTLWSSKPTQFWYFYPTYDVATTEFREKWEKEFLPRGEYKDHPVYGWRHEMRNKQIYAIYFNSGVSLYFHSYEQDAENLQTASVYAIFCDEELPEHLYPEIAARLSSATIRGYFHHVFTATLAQEFWRLAIEEDDPKQATFKKAFKRQISLYDCMVYMDGRPGPWTQDLIDEQIASYGTQAEVDRRVKGKFVRSELLKYPGFVRSKNFVKGHKLPKDWLIYAGVDIGSGGEGGHPSAIVFVAVNRDFTQGRVFKGWRGDKIVTTGGDVVDKYVELRGRMKPVGQYYDHAARDFFTVASRRKLGFDQADKGDAGVGMLNTLFKLGILQIYDGEEGGELIKLVNELCSLKTDTPKQKAKDDFTDALRYAVSKIPWDFDKARKGAKKKKAEDEMSDRERTVRGLHKPDNHGLDLIAAEIDLANDMYGYYDEEAMDEFECDD